jgi:hypothetical protein
MQSWKSAIGGQGWKVITFGNYELRITNEEEVGKIQGWKYLPLLPPA